MLVAKINPPAKRIVQTTPFSQTELTGEYMVARCTQLNIDPTPNTPTDEIIFYERNSNSLSFGFYFRNHSWPNVNLSKSKRYYKGGNLPVGKN